MSFTKNEDVEAIQCPKCQRHTLSFGYWIDEHHNKEVVRYCEQCQYHENALAVFLRKLTDINGQLKVKQEQLDKIVKAISSLGDNMVLENKKLQRQWQEFYATNIVPLQAEIDSILLDFDKFEKEYLLNKNQ
ncbi:MAG: hypothetical protein J6A33_06825 [Alphaproteobacteria bacterium]|nr:hypothetical protein [Alphaproteobacteria bacterium]MBP3702351.1 hypothetical protein [Lachnospiraceae bacterium]